MISLIDVLKIHQRVIDYDKEENPDDYTPAILSLATLELMFEYMIKESNTVFQNATIIVYTVPLQKYFPHTLRLFLFPSNLILIPI